MEPIKKQEVLGKCFKVYGTAENPLFFAKDVAEWIEIKQPSVMLQNVDEDEKILLNNTVISNHTISAGNPTKWFLTENGLYEVLMLSRKPIAKQFKKEVKKILHEIRMTGGYTVPKTFEQALRLAADQQKQIAELKPKADVYDDYVERGQFCNFRDAANYLRVSQTELMDLLKSKYIYKNSVGEYRNYAEYSELFILRPFEKGKNRTGQQLLLTIAGLNYFGRILSERHLERQQEIMNSAMDAAKSLMEGMQEICPVNCRVTA
mgnify:CR=1 FL=1